MPRGEGFICFRRHCKAGTSPVGDGDVTLFLPLDALPSPLMEIDVGRIGKLVESPSARNEMASLSESIDLLVIAAVLCAAGPPSLCLDIPVRLSVYQRAIIHVSLSVSLCLFPCI